MTPESISSALGKSSRKQSGGFMAQCPCHDDSTGSLSIDEKDGRILLKCFAGCENTAIIEKLKNMDLWPAPDKIEVSKPKRRIVAE